MWLSRIVQSARGSLPHNFADSKQETRDRTDDFIAHIRAASGGWDLGQASYFLVVAATLLDLKAARLLPAGA